MIIYVLTTQDFFYLISHLKIEDLMISRIIYKTYREKYNFRDRDRDKEDNKFKG